MPEDTLTAPEADCDDVQDPHELTTRGVFVAASAIHAVLPVRMVTQCVENTATKPTSDGLFLFEKTSRIDTDNLVMRVRPRSESYFKTFTPFSRPEEFTNLRMAVRDLGSVTPFASDYARLARVYGWPQLLYVWTDEESIFIRRAFTEEVWERMDTNRVATRRYVLAHKELFGLLPATRV